MLAYDLIYEPSETRFLQDARSAGAAGINGLDMLIEQAAAAFTLWTGLEMPVEEIKKNLAKKVDNQ
jgi:shikimate dehydrogenase